MKSLKELKCVGIVPIVDIKKGENSQIFDEITIRASPPIYIAQLYGRSRQCNCPVGARGSMGLGWNQLINSLSQHTFKLNILFVDKFTEIHFD